MSEVSKQPAKKETGSKKDLPKAEENPKDKKAGPVPKKDDTKKDLPKVEEGSKESKDGKAKKQDTKKELDSMYLLTQMKRRNSKEIRRQTRTNRRTKMPLTQR